MTDPNKNTDRIIDEELADSRKSLLESYRSSISNNVFVGLQLAIIFLAEVQLATRNFLSSGIAIALREHGILTPILALTLGSGLNAFLIATSWATLSRVAINDDLVGVKPNRDPMVWLHRRYEGKLMTENLPGKENQLPEFGRPWSLAWYLFKQLWSWNPVFFFASQRGIFFLSNGIILLLSAIFVVKGIDFSSGLNLVYKIVESGIAISFLYLGWHWFRIDSWNTWNEILKEEASSRKAKTNTKRP